jgi:hypothetical protein
MTASALPDRQVDDDLIRPILFGGAAALAGGAIWAAIVGITNFEVGWVAWGIGGLVGLAMRKATSLRNTTIAAIAAGLAILGLLAGKVMIQVFVTRPAFEQALREDDNAVASVLAWNMREEKEFEPALQARLDALGENDTLPDALWEEMTAAANVEAEGLTEEERNEMKEHYVSSVLADVGPWQQLGWGFSLYDLLWFALAISTAWRMLREEAPSEPQPVSAAGT